MNEEKLTQETKKEHFKADDMILLVNTLGGTHYSFDFIKQVIHELDTALQVSDGSNQKDIVFHIIKEEHGPSNKEIATELISVLQKSMK